MELLPPVGWADVATRHDVGSLQQELVAFEGGMDARFAVVDARFESLEGRFDAKLEGLEGRFDAKLETLEHRLDARFEKGFRQIVVTMMSLFITGFVARSSPSRRAERVTPM